MEICFHLGGVFFTSASDEDNALALQAMLEALIAVDRVYLRRNKGTPKLYESGVRYGRTQVWDSIPDLLKRRYGDCFPAGSLLLRDDFELIPIEEARVGDRIWGHDAWTTIKAHVYKGLLSVDALVLNNGSRVLLTGDHHVFVARCACPEHHPWVDPGCACGMDERVVERVRLREVQPREVVLTPGRLPFGEQSLPVGAAHASSKPILSLDLNESAAADTLRRVMAEGVRRKRGWDFSTTSKRLAIQVRLLQKMFGRSCASLPTMQPGISTSAVAKSSVWGLGVYDPQENKLLRVKRVERDLIEAPCYDIETSDGYVYLPEYDATVSNCKSLTAMYVAELREAGQLARPVFRFAMNPQSNQKDFHILVQRGKTFEDPSRKLGMAQFHAAQGMWAFPS